MIPTRLLLIASLMCSGAFLQAFSQDFVGLDSRDLMTLRRVHEFSVPKWKEQFAKISEAGQALLAKESQNYSVILIDSDGLWRARVGTNVRIEISRKGIPGDSEALLACLDVDIYRQCHPNTIGGLSQIWSKDNQRRFAANAPTKEDVVSVRAAIGQIDMLADGDKEAKERILASVGDSLAGLPRNFVVELLREEPRDSLVTQAMVNAMRGRDTQLAHFNTNDFLTKDPRATTLFNDPELVWEKATSDVTSQKIFTTKVGPDANIVLVIASNMDENKIFSIRSMEQLKAATAAGTIQGFFASPWDKKPSKIDTVFKAATLPRE